MNCLKLNSCSGYRAVRLSPAVHSRAAPGRMEVGAERYSHMEAKGRQVRGY